MKQVLSSILLASTLTTSAAYAQVGSNASGGVSAGGTSAGAVANPTASPSANPTASARPGYPSTGSTNMHTRAGAGLKTGTVRQTTGVGVDGSAGTTSTTVDETGRTGTAPIRGLGVNTGTTTNGY
jgi:hypothetical protein